MTSDSSSPSVPDNKYAKAQGLLPLVLSTKPVYKTAIEREVSASTFRPEYGHLDEFLNNTQPVIAVKDMCPAHHIAVILQEPQDKGPMAVLLNTLLNIDPAEYKGGTLETSADAQTPQTTGHAVVMSHDAYKKMMRKMCQTLCDPGKAAKFFGFTEPANYRQALSAPNEDPTSTEHIVRKAAANALNESRFNVSELDTLSREASSKDNYEFMALVNTQKILLLKKREREEPEIAFYEGRTRR